MKPNGPRLGSEIVQLLLPHRRPFVFVDAIEEYEPGGSSLRASFQVSASHEVFGGHFPGLHLWPGVYTIEGLGQTANLLAVFMGLEADAAARGEPKESVLAALRNIQLGYRLQPGFRHEEGTAFAKRIAASGGRMGINASVEMKFVKPVFAGSRLDYSASLARLIDEVFRFEVEAQVDGAQVARGVLLVKRAPPVPGAPPV